MKSTHFKSKWYFRVMAPVPMISQMTAMLFMAANGRPSLEKFAPDWVLHIVAYTALALFSWLTWQGLIPDLPNRKSLLFATTTAILFSVLDEGVQIFSPFRTAQLSDLMADFAGVLFSLICVYLITLFLKEIQHDR